MLGAERATAAGVAALAERLGRSVVEVRSDQSGGGTGVIWGGGGLIVTNAHCIRREDKITVGADGAYRDARVIAVRPEHDLALLAASVTGPLLDARDALTLRTGELVFAYGHPLGVHDALAMGVAHGVARDARSRQARWVVADIRLAPGNSGGPLVDSAGRLVGINSMVVNGMGVAIPVALVDQFIARAMRERAA
jgi:serine protease Do